MAGEIHDTLAQGFTSIVLLSRSAQRKSPAIVELSEIESEAQSNLDTARRLVAASRTGRAGLVSLPGGDRTPAVAIRSSGVSTGSSTSSASPDRCPATPRSPCCEERRKQCQRRDPRRRHLDHHRALLRHRHAIDLEVTDDGPGFTHGEVADRGTLTGGQGLRLLAERAAITRRAASTSTECPTTWHDGLPTLPGGQP